MRVILALLVALFLPACATPHDKTMLVNGQPVIAHIDYTDNPCGTRGPDAGCAQTINGVRRAWFSGAASYETMSHELGHDKIKHGEWRQHRYFGNCAEITEASPGYPLGGLICHNEGRRERIIPAGYLDNASS